MSAIVPPLDPFLISATWLLGAEGFWSDDPVDRGGATKHGISLRFLRQLGPEGDLDGDGDVDVDDVRRVSVTEALRLYRHHFWDACKCNELPAGLDTAVFCGAVNHGPDIAKTLLQAALRVKQDGRLGPVTLGAAARIAPAVSVPEYLSHRARFYSDIVAADASQARFLRGWYYRLFSLTQFIFTERLA